MKTKSKILLSVFLLLIFVFVNEYDKLGSTVSILLRETSGSPSIYFCPQDDCKGQLIYLIRNSDRIDCAFYDLDLDKVIDELKSKNAKLVIDKDNSHEVKELDYVKNENAWGLMHNKFCIIDDEIILTGSFNPTERGNYYNNNNLVVIRSKYLADNYKTEFEELWNGRFASGEKIKNQKIYLNGKEIENYFCPEDLCEERVINALKKAKESIYFMTFVFTSNEVGDVLIEKNNQNVDVKGVIEKTRISDWSEHYRLGKEGIEVRLDNNRYVMHHKVFIIDGKTVITGSFNPTKSANEDNDENILIIHDENIAKQYLEEFERVWNFEEKLDTQVKKSDSIALSEVYYDCSGKDSEEEFIEIYNPTDEEINLDYYFLSNNKTDQRLSDILKPKSTKVIDPKFALNNNHGLIILKKNFEQVDFVSWESLWVIKAKTGQSIQRNSFEKVNSESEWVLREPTPYYI
jgi:hypothetical protein